MLLKFSLFLMIIYQKYLILVYGSITFNACVDPESSIGTEELSPAMSMQSHWKPLLRLDPHSIFIVFECLTNKMPGHGVLHFKFVFRANTYSTP